MTTLPSLTDLAARAPEALVEGMVERMMDCADSALLGGLATQSQYDTWCKRLDAWARRNTKGR